MTLAGIVAAFQIGKGVIALPDLRQEFGMSLAHASWFISIFNVIGLAGGLVAGVAADHFGNRRALLLGLVVICLTNVSGAMAPNSTFLLATRFAEGLGFVLIVVAAPALLVRATNSSRRKLAFGLWGSYMPCGMALMMFLAPFILAFHWRILWLANALCAALCTAAVALITRPHVREQRSSFEILSVKSTFADTLTRPGPLFLALAFASYTLAFLAVMGFLPTILMEGNGFGRVLAATLAAAAVAVNMIGTLAGGVILQRGVRRWVIMTIAALSMAASSLIIFGDFIPFVARYIAVLVFSAVGGLLPTAVLSAAPVHATSSNRLGAVNGLVMQGSNLGQVLGPPIAAFVAQSAGGWHWSPAIVGATAMSMIACAAALRIIESR